MDGESVKVRKLCHLIESERITFDHFEQIVRQISNKSRPTWRRESPLVSSAKKGRQDFVEHLIEVEKFDVNSRCSDPVNWCPLAAAIANRHYEMARVLVLRYKADPNIRRSATESILTKCLVDGNLDAVRVLISQLRADVNVELLKNPGSGFSFYPIHLSIWHDFTEGSNLWSRTKLVLALGADLTKKGFWRKDRKCLVLGEGQKVTGSTDLKTGNEIWRAGSTDFRIGSMDWRAGSTDLATGNEAWRAGTEAWRAGSPLQFAKEIQTLVCHDSKKSKIVAGLVELLQEEPHIRIMLNFIDHKFLVINSFLANVNHKKILFRSPLVYAASKGRQDLVQLMVRHFGFGVDAVEDNTGLNALAVAVNKGDLHLTEFLVRGLGANVDYIFNDVIDENIAGPVLLPALKSGDLQMVSLLLEHLSANPNLTIYVEGKPTTLLIFAIEYLPNEHKVEHIRVLMDNDVDPIQRGWVRVHGRFRSWTPLELATQHQLESQDPVWRQISHLLNNAIRIRNASSSSRSPSWIRILLRRVVLFCTGE